MEEFSNEEYRKMEGFEVGGIPPLPDPHGPLKNALMSDFAPRRADVDQDVLDNPNAHIIDWLVAFSPKMPGREEAKLRYRSDVAQRLAADVQVMLDDAAITATFKHRIVNEVRRAYAEEKSVTDDVSPDRLGLTDGSRGIFDEDEAPQIEEKHLRYFLLRIVGKNLRTTKSDNEEFAKTNVLHPSEYAQDMRALNSWVADYINKFKKSPLDELNQRAYMLAIQVFEELSKS